MCDPSQQCPSWRQRQYCPANAANIRLSGRLHSSEGSCSTASFSTTLSGSYSRVYERVIGYQVASPDAFLHAHDMNIDFDGVNIMYGNQRHHNHLELCCMHGGASESFQQYGSSNCPCSTAVAIGSRSKPLSFIRNSYYCESGNPNDNYRRNQIFISDPLWNGRQCEGTCCNGTNSPPWFGVYSSLLQQLIQLK